MHVTRDDPGIQDIERQMAECQQAQDLKFQRIVATAPPHMRDALRALQLSDKTRTLAAMADLDCDKLKRECYQTGLHSRIEKLLPDIDELSHQRHRLEVVAKRAQQLFDDFMEERT